MSTMAMTDSARRWGALWGSMPRAWAVSEDQQVPTYEEALRAADVGSGDRLLDIGCGVGTCLRVAADLGAIVSGLDASEGLLALARERVPEADLHLGDMQSLPFGDDAFDVVTGFNSFFFADDMVAALAEARRVARPGAPVVIQVWGRPERCDLEAMKQAVRRFRPAPEGGGEPPAYWRPGVVDELAERAGLVVERALDTTWAFEYPGGEELADAMVAAGGIAEVAGPDRQDQLRAALLEALAGCRQPDGTYRVSNEWHVVIARA